MISVCVRDKEIIVTEMALSIEVASRLWLQRLPAVCFSGGTVLVWWQSSVLELEVKVCQFIYCLSQEMLLRTYCGSGIMQRGVRCGSAFQNSQSWDSDMGVF